MLTKKVRSLPVADIHFSREARQRTTIDVSDIIESVRKRGVLTPICVTESGLLIFGERRLTAARECGHTHILARIAPDNLNPHDLQLLELEENIMRQDLSWQDRAKAMAKLYELSGAASQRIFADSVGYSYGLVSMALDASRAIAAGNERVATAPTLNRAINVISRAKEREEHNLLTDIVDSLGPVSTPLEPEAEPILCQSFHTWAPAYRGPKFNVIHCDFPYGIDLDDSAQLQGIKTAEDAGSQQHQTYEDSEETFWRLLETLFLYEDRLVSSSAHMIFWFSMKHYERLLQWLRRSAPQWTFDDYPLIWHKTDNRGIAPDVVRRPRRIYETALFGWRGDRKTVKLVANAYGSPKEASAHPSTKPEAMLRHFLSAVVDRDTRVLDPTCGSGSALRAADALGAGLVLGLEQDPEFAAGALAKLRAARGLARLSEAVV